MLPEEALYDIIPWIFVKRRNAMTLETMMQREVMLGNIEKQLEDMTAAAYGKSIAECSNAQVYSCVLRLVKEMIEATPAISGDKKVYYISAEFLIGKLLSNNLINLRLYDKVDEILKKNGKNVQIKLYDGCRHEILNDVCREEVINDILTFVES